MVYDSERKLLNGIELTKLQWQIFEVLLEHINEPLSANDISNILCDKYYISGINSAITDYRSVRAHISRLNKKSNGLIKRKYYAGYYIEEDIKIM